MARTPSTMLPLGTPAPDFVLPNPSGRQYARDEVKGEKGLLVMFMCPHCPFVKHVRPELARLGRHCQGVGIGVVAIMPNDVEKYPDDAPDKMAAEAVEAGYTFPYLHDASQAVAKAYRAACTPDFYLFDRDLRLAYRGQLDDSRPGNDIPVSGRDLRAAVDALVSGQPVPEAQRPSLGCNVKWIPGNEPDYYGAQ
jgi:thiol-disulfide isomerase/thioredoxin